MRGHNFVYFLVQLDQNPSFLLKLLLSVLLSQLMDLLQKIIEILIIKGKRVYLDFRFLDVKVRLLCFGRHFAAPECACPVEAFPRPRVSADLRAEHT
jgi:hypothetical protein